MQGFDGAFQCRQFRQGQTLRLQGTAIGYHPRPWPAGGLHHHRRLACHHLGFLQRHHHHQQACLGHLAVLVLQEMVLDSAPRSAELDVELELLATHLGPVLVGDQLRRHLPWVCRWPRRAIPIPANHHLRVGCRAPTRLLPWGFLAVVSLALQLQGDQALPGHHHLRPVCLWPGRVLRRVDSMQRLLRRRVFLASSRLEESQQVALGWLLRHRRLLASCRE